ncbi:transmembrane channel-like protein [Euwallacea fornicatus]|uniref:transmembrane channel-like protein n=1 Tax=Euwallacea fornicatus TaxID=995702 RepID=UPI00338F75F5
MDPQQSPTMIRRNPELQNISTRSFKEATARILRLEASRLTGSDLKIYQKELVSRQFSIDGLLVKFANRSDSPKRMQARQHHPQDRVQLPEQSADGNISDEDDYSASVNAIIQRRASTRRSKKQSRRPSSPFLAEAPGPERRRSSVFTTSSGDTAITVDDNAVNEVTQEEIFENIKLHKEVLSNVKMQPWSMRKKLKLVVQAKAYIKKHEGQLHERLAQSHSTKDMLATWNIVLIKKWQKWKRELTNMSMWFIPWELKIKEIESHFGSVVASYFIFLRWLFWVNIVIAVAIISFVTIPEIITSNKADTLSIRERKSVLPEEKYNSTNFLTLWDFEGVFKYSALFYGWYSNRDYNDSSVFSSHGRGYRLPFAYFITGLVVYAYSFFATLRKMAENSRMSKRSEKDDECIFSWKLFTAWDYMVGNAETAHNRVASIVMGFKEALLEEAEKKRESRNWKVICFRVLVNTLVLGLLTCSAFAVIVVVRRSQESEATSTVWRRNEITVVMTLITFFFPMLFEVLGFAEQYHPRKQLRLQLARIMFLNLLNLYSLIFALFDKIDDMQMTYASQFKDYKRNQSTEVALYTTQNSQGTTSVSYFDLSFSNAPCICSENFIVSPTDSTHIATLASTLTTMVTPSLNTLASLINSTFIPSTSSYYESKETFTYHNITETDFDENGTLTFETTFPSTISSENVTDMFESYLNSTWFSSTPYTPSENNSVTSYSNYSEPTIDDFDTFKSSLLSLLDVTTTFEPDERFNFEIRTLYNEVASTIASELSISNEMPTTEAATEDYCKIYCANPTSVAMVVPSTAAPTINSVPLNYTMKAKLRSHCWETMFGQELIKLTVMDLIMTGLSILMIDFFRGIFVRVMNRCWCWDLEKKFPQYGDFKVAENILHLVNNQGMVWMGMFFSPGLVVLNVIKLYALMYLRTWAVLTCNVPHEIIFRASRSNNFYYALLLVMLFLCVLPVGYAIVWIEPSSHCGPFSEYQKIFHIFTKTIKANIPVSMHRVLDYVASPSIVIPLLLLLVLIIYYMVSLTKALKEANNDLKAQLRRERTEERRKMFQLAVRRRRGGSGESTEQTPFDKWKKVLRNLPSTRSYDDTRQESDDVIPSQKEKYDDKVENKGKVFFTKLIKKALRQPTLSDEEQDATDTEQHESLPYDTVQGHKPIIKTEASESVVMRTSLMMRPSKQKDNTENDSSILQQVVTVHRDPSPKSKSKSSRSEAIKQPSRKENSFLKTIIEAKKLGVFDEKVEPIIDQPAQRQDSSSSIWSDNIPVITISKTLSDDNVLEKDESKASVETIRKTTKRKFIFKEQTSISDEEDSMSIKKKTMVNKFKEPTSFQPRVKCLLQKQENAIDEDVIIHFGNDLEKTKSNKRMVFDLINSQMEEANKDSNDKSTSEETELRDDNSVDTILNAPFFEEDEDFDGNGEMEIEENSPGSVSEGNGENLENDKLQLSGGIKSSSRSQIESSSSYKQ